MQPIEPTILEIKDPLKLKVIHRLGTLAFWISILQSFIKEQQSKLDGMLRDYEKLLSELRPPK